MQLEDDQLRHSIDVQVIITQRATLLTDTTAIIIDDALEVIYK